MSLLVAVRSVFAAAAVASLLTPVAAQLHAAVAMNSGTHTHGGPYWTDNVGDPQAEAGIVSQLNFIWWLEHHSPPMLLQPGTYVAQMRLAKIVNAVGRFDLTIGAESNGVVLSSVVMPAASQPVGSYVWSPEVIFEVTQPRVVDISVRNGNTLLSKELYRFDTARVGLLPLGGTVLKTEPLAGWNIANPTFFNYYEARPEAVYGRVMAVIWWPVLVWMDIRKTMPVPAGNYVANFRFRSGVFLCNLTVEARHAITGQVLASAVIPVAAQQGSTWTMSPDIVFALPAAADVTFAIYNHSGPDHWGYEFDCFVLRSQAPSFTPFGQACGGITLAQTQALQIGGTGAFEVGGLAPSAMLGVFAFGSPVAPVPLGFLGANGCLLHVTPDVLLTAPVVSGAATVSITVPPTPSLFGYRLDVQGAALDAAAPGALLSANAGRATVGF